MSSKVSNEPQPNIDSLIKDITIWQQQSIEKIRQIANEIQEELIDVIYKTKYFDRSFRIRNRMSFNARLLSIIGGCLLTLTAIFLTLSNILPLWRSMTSSFISITFGIWQICTRSNLFGTKYKCETIPCGKDRDANINCNILLAGRILFISTCVIAMISALSFLLIALIDEKFYRKLFIISMVKILAIISLLMGIFTIVIITYYTGNVQNYLHMSLDLSVYLGILALIINFIGIIVGLLIT